MTMKCLLLIMLVFASDENENVLKSDTKSEERNVAKQPIIVKIEEDEYVKVNKKTSNYIGVSYNQKYAIWCAYRRSKKENKTVYNGSAYEDEEIAAHASDTLARKLIANGEKDHKLNFPDDDTEVYPEKISKYIGVSYNQRDTTWCAQRWSKYESKAIHNGTFKDEERAAHASDTLARKLIANGKKGHKLNFPDDDTEVYAEQKTNYIGVNYNKRAARWCSSRWSKTESKTVFNGTFKDEETAAYASDTLARKLMANGEKGHKLNFPDDNSEVYSDYAKKKRKRHNTLELPQDSKSHQISKK